MHAREVTKMCTNAKEDNLLNDQYELHHLIQEANTRKVENLSKSSQESPLPDWIDPKAIIAGKKFVSRHFFLVFFTHFISLILLLSYIPVRVILLKTRKSHTVELALTRYLSTLRHIKMWYEGDLTSPHGEAVRDIIKVRKIHNGVSERIENCWKSALLPASGLRKDGSGGCDSVNSMQPKTLLEALKKVFSSGKEAQNNNKNVCMRDSITVTIFGISQLDMMVTQYCFMGLLTTFPQKFGIDLSNKNDIEGLKGFNHIWAVIGHVLGIEDRFNLGLVKNSSLKTVILNDILLKDLAETKPETVVLWEALVNAMSTFVPCLSLHAALLCILEHILGIRNCNFLFKDAKLYDRFCYFLTTFLIKTCLKHALISNIFNGLLRLAIYLMSLRIDLIKIVVQAL